ncbi:hypothetical protein V6N11_036454 [Hibiscus sabdariffa]|uniref:HAT C-terminal dimerisation domain-containing protein n=1 Tax=Hibiscus sabdariffa TaxID=183260 RepID=A0ABR2RAG4_9ROSI
MTTLDVVRILGRHRRDKATLQMQKQNSTSFQVAVRRKAAPKLEAYKDARGLFGLPRAIKLRKTKSPAEWWSLFGSSTPNLQMFAIKVFNNDTGCAGNHGEWAQNSFATEERDNKALEYIDRKWDCDLHRSLRAAAYFLNPGIHYDHPNGLFCEQVMKGLYDFIERYYPEIETQDNIITEIETFRNAQGHFGLPRAIKLRKTKSPAEWWSMFGSSTPNLQMFAIEVFNYDTGCHRNHGLHTRKRHRVSQNHYLTTTSKIMKENSGLSSKFDKGKDVPTSSAPRSTRKVVDDDDEIEEDIGEDETYYFEYNEDDDEIEEDIGEDEIYYYEYNEDDDDDDLK